MCKAAALTSRSLLPLRLQGSSRCCLWWCGSDGARRCWGEGDEVWDQGVAGDAQQWCYLASSRETQRASPWELQPSAPAVPPFSSLLGSSRSIGTAPGLASVKDEGQERERGARGVLQEGRAPTAAALNHTAAIICLLSWGWSLSEFIKLVFLEGEKCWSLIARDLLWFQ